jgi:2'-5' RNA ligase
MPELVPTSHLRIFIALTVPDRVKTEMAKVQTELREALSRIGKDRARWTKVEQLHLTLKFLGNVEAARIDDLVAAVRGACRSFASLRMRAGGIGCFPNLRAPRAVWAGVRDLDEKLPELQRAVAEAARACTLEAEPETFAGHVTLCRLKGVRSQEAEVLAVMAERMAGGCFGESTADKVEVMRSELSSQGAQHRYLATIPLGQVA